MNRRALLTLAPLAAGAIAVSALPVQASEGGGSGPANSYLRFQALTATIIRPDGRRGVMTVEVGLDIHDADLLLRAQQDTPRLRAAYNVVVQRAAAELLPGTPPDVDRLSRELQATTTRTLRRSGATLLLGTVMVV